MNHFHRFSEELCGQMVNIFISLAPCRSVDLPNGFNQLNIKFLLSLLSIIKIIIIGIGRKYSFELILLLLNFYYYYIFHILISSLFVNCLCFFMIVCKPKSGLFLELSNVLKLFLSSQLPVTSRPENVHNALFPP